MDGPTRGDRIANGRNPRAGNDELRQRNGGRSSEDLRNGGRSSEDLRNGRRSSEDLRNGERSRQNSGRLNGSGSDDMINEHFYDVPEVSVCVQYSFSDKLVFIKTLTTYLKIYFKIS